MHQRERAFEIRIVQVWIVGAELVGEEHPLVDHRAARDRYRVIAGGAALATAIDRIRDRLAQDVEPALEFILRHLLLAAADEHLHVLRFGRLDRLAERRVVGRHVAPAEQRQLLARNDLRVDVTDNLPPVRVLRHEQIADGIFAGGRQFESKLGSLLRKELVRHLHQNAGAVTHARIGADRAAVLEIAKNAQSIFDELVRLAALDVGDETDAAGILIERRIVETLRQRRAGIGGRAASGKSSAALLLAHLILPRRRARRFGVPASSARLCARGQRATDLEKGQPVRRCRRPWLHLFGRHRCLPRDLRAATRARQPLGQHYCPNGPCQILPCRTRLVHAGLSEILRFIAAVVEEQQDKPRRAPFHAMLLRFGTLDEAPVNRLTSASGTGGE